MYILDKQIENFNFAIWQELCQTEGSALLINKKSNWTSFDVIAKLRKLLGIRKIGHCGTLDPFATGLLILCLGKATKQIETFQNLPKQYRATIKLGATTKSFDTEYPEENVIGSVSHLSGTQIEEVVAGFVGKIEQIPPVFSAKKVAGKKLYELARKGKAIDFELKPSLVEIFRIEIKSIELPFLEVIVYCSKGTYIRALARDIGAQLGAGGYLTALERTAIGDYLVENAFCVKEVADWINA